MHTVHSPFEVAYFPAYTNTSTTTSAYVTVLNEAFIGRKEILASTCKDSQRFFCICNTIWFFALQNNKAEYNP